MKQGKVMSELLVPYMIYRHVIGNSPTTDTYDNRLLWQKVGYLSQQMGLPLDEFNFNWHLAGPYSSSYTSVLYGIRDNVGTVSNQANEFTLNPGAKQKLNILKELVNKCPEDMTVAKWSELLASIHYLSKNGARTKEQTIKKLLRLKPFFNNLRVNNYAWSLLENSSLL
ncbi:hypothetical protein [Bacillus sp. NH11B]|uniref:hypothetical protein n=1 Tax=Bacillus sp. NH11B TaxID=1866314 RepID=UPI0008FDF7B2|nr:hypothetical protein [Bacillus sp. NH11B]OJD62799.1 hypothetical protein BAU27_10885 [Bacillus sp. NH11B]